MTTCDLPDGGRLHYQSEGVGTAPVVLLHPGYTNSTVP